MADRGGDVTRPPYRWPDPDRDYANGDFIPGGADFPDRWAAKAAAFRAGQGPRLQQGVAYGPGDRQRLDLFLPESDPCGTVIFIHGGYWKAFDRSFWSHLAAGPLARGFRVVMPSYTLAPEARITAMTVEIAKVCDWAASLGTGPIVVTGHSAGGHLAARMGCADQALQISRVVPISPLTELGPLLATSMNAILGIDPAEAAAESPARLALRPGVAAHVWVGAAERPAFLWQARVLAEEWDCAWTAAPEKHHFDVIDALEHPASPLCEVLVGGL
ncbi:MAG: alpha/beta hydrolase [Rhodobacter sp.]|nr:alpha/beta hydrolase [Rhodobacter sp.]